MQGSSERDLEILWPLGQQVLAARSDHQLCVDEHRPRKRLDHRDQSIAQERVRILLTPALIAQTDHAILECFFRPFEQKNLAGVLGAQGQEREQGLEVHGRGPQENEDRRVPFAWPAKLREEPPQRRRRLGYAAGEHVGVFRQVQRLQLPAVRSRVVEVVDDSVGLLGVNSSTVEDGIHDLEPAPARRRVGAFAVPGDPLGREVGAEDVGRHQERRVKIRQVHTVDFPWPGSGPAGQDRVQRLWLVLLPNLAL
mmetsp:Transcript_147296/g.473201  ORF Transcript_147296/g.473201 Transcript_147296/m.473201 type:complete len:253 (+) Transcript_147296:320-1078(+)